MTESQTCLGGWNKAVLPLYWKLYVNYWVCKIKVGPMLKSHSIVQLWLCTKDVRGSGGARIRPCLLQSLPARLAAQL